MSLKRQTITGLIWSFVELMLRRGVSGITTLILAWFLAPADFGLLAMVAVFIAVANVFVDAGLSQTLIRKQFVSDREYNTAFYTNIAIALLVYGLLFAAAPVIANFYEQLKLIELLRVAGLAVILNALAVVQRAVLSRELKFKLQMQVSIPAAACSGLIAIALAYLNFGIWALIVQIVAQAMLNSLLYWRLALWRPNYSFGFNEFKELFSFGGYLLLAQIINVVFKNIYVIVIAKLFSTHIAGFYFFAEKIRDLLLDQLVASVQTVTYPALARLQDEPKRLKNGFRQIILSTTFILFPLLIFVAALIETIFRLFLPETWWQAAGYLQLMCLAALLYPLNSVNLNILKVKGRSDLVFYLGLFKKVIAITIFAYTYRFGITGILIGQIVSSMFAYLPNSYYSKRLIDYSVREQLTDVVPNIVLAGGIGLMIWLLKGLFDLPELVNLFVFGLGGALSYLLTALIFKLHALDLVWDILTNKGKKKTL